LLEKDKELQAMKKQMAEQSSELRELKDRIESDLIYDKKRSNARYQSQKEFKDWLDKQGSPNFMLDFLVSRGWQRDEANRILEM
jgi:uncharacterized membrane protein YcaP (DUF421 family)